MKKVRKDLIKRLFEDATLHDRVLIKQEFPKLFKEEKKLNGWYKDKEQKKWCVFLKDGIMINGFDSSGNWFEGHNYTYELQEDDYKATDKEGEQALIKEAKKIGLKTSNHSCLEDGAIWNNITGSEYRYYPKENKLMIGASTVFLDGKWATIIKETITKEQFEEAKEVLAQYHK